MTYRIGAVQKKLLILLAGGVSLLLSRTPKKQFKVLSATQREWRKVNRQALQRAIRSLYESKLIESKDNPDGSITMALSGQGKKKALTYDLDKIAIPRPARWDRKWRLVLFDVPERFKKEREALRLHLKRLGLHQFQKSAFVVPFECEDEINFIVEFYNLRPHVRYLIVSALDNELHLKSIFRLL